MKGLMGSARFKIILISVGGVLLLYALVGFLLIPAVLSNQIPKLTEEKLAHQAQVEKIRFNPFSLEFRIDGFNVNNEDDSPFVSFERFYVNLALLRSIANLTLSFDQVELDRPYALVRRHKDGDFNFSDLLTKSEPETEKNEPNDDTIFPVAIKQITISEGKLSWEDRYYGTSQHEDIYPLNLNLSDLTTVVDRNSQLGFSLMFASGGSFNWNGKLSLNPLLSTGHIKLEKISFPRVWELFLKNIVQFQILQGSELLEADYQLSDSPQGLQFRVDKAHVDIYDVQIAEQGSPESLLTIPDLKVSGIALDLLNKTVNVAGVSAKDANFVTWLNPDGSINYQSLFTPKFNAQATSSPQPKSASASQEPPWQLTVKQLAFSEFGLQLTDKTLPKPAQLKLSGLDLALQDITNKPGSRLPFKLNLTVNKSGKLQLQGDAVIDPFSADLHVKADDIAINDFQPYIDKALRLDVVSGLFHVDAGVSLQQTEEKPIAIHIQGDSQVTEFVTQDRVAHKDFLKWKQLSLNDLDLDLAKNNYHIETIKLSRPFARVQIRKDKSVNVADVVVASTKPEKSANEGKKTTKPEDTPQFKISRIEITEGESDFSDLSLILPFSVYIKQLHGSINELTSEPNDVAKIKLNGRVNNLSPVSIQGSVSPYQGNSEIALDFTSLSLPTITPYMAEFAGRKIKKGNMSLTLNYKINNQQLSASNKLFIDQLQLGTEVENPDAVSLPLDLAIALLEDSNGQIKLDVPIEGSLEDPQFSVGGIIADALVNVITKIVTSPFNAIASLIDSDEDISQVRFPAGKASLSEEQQKKLDELATALADRPRLQLEIKGTAFSARDWPSLQNEALQNKLLDLKASELKRENNTEISRDKIELIEDERERLLADLFIQQHPELAERSFFGSPQLIKPEMGDFYQVASDTLATEIPPNPQRLEQLAISRAQAIAQYLIAKNIDVNRLFLLDVDVDPTDAEDDTVSILNLTVQ